VDVTGPGVSVVFVCEDGEGRILLARRGAGARDEPGAWDCGAGALEFGESFESAVAREVEEEYATAPLHSQLPATLALTGPDQSHRGMGRPPGTTESGAS